MELQTIKVNRPYLIAGFLINFSILISEVRPGIAGYDGSRRGIAEGGAGTARSQIRNCSIAVAGRDVVVRIVATRAVTNEDIIGGA